MSDLRCRAITRHPQWHTHRQDTLWATHPRVTQQYLLEVLHPVSHPTHLTNMHILHCTKGLLDRRVHRRLTPHLEVITEAIQDIDQLFILFTVHTNYFSVFWKDSHDFFVMNVVFHCLDHVPRHIRSFDHST